jgi:hypothetical protein
MRRLFPIAASLFLLAAAGNAASATGRYRIELKDGRQVETRGYPVARGSVWTFHESNGGVLTGVPREMVVRIVPDDEAEESVALVSARAVAAASTSAEGDLEEAPAPLEPGDLIELPSTGDGPGAAPPASGATARAGAGVPVNVNGYGGLPNPYSGTSIYGTSNGLAPGAIGPDGMPRVLSSTDLSRALSATTPAGSIGSNGFQTVAPTAPTVVGPDGTPTLGTGVSTQFVIGPDGTPVLAGGTATPVTTIGPNGTPTLASAGQPGFSGPAIGSNGTPILAGAGQPGSAGPAIGPNGTPVLAPAGQPGSAVPAIGSNGTPAVPAPGAHH